MQVALLAALFFTCLLSFFAGAFVQYHMKASYVCNVSPL